MSFLSFDASPSVRGSECGDGEREGKKKKKTLGKVYNSVPLFFFFCFVRKIGKVYSSFRSIFFSFFFCIRFVLDLFLGCVIRRLVEGFVCVKRLAGLVASGCGLLVGRADAASAV